MKRYSTRPRRLRVSALAAVANPSYARVDTWNLLDDACCHLAEVDLAGMDITHDMAKVRRLMDRIGAYERYWLYPGAQNLANFRAHLESKSTVRLKEEVSLAVRLLGEYGDRTALFDTSAPLAEQELVAQAKQQQFYTVLVADDAPTSAPDSLAEHLRALHIPSDDVQFEVLLAPSVEDAITAVALNGEIQAAIIRHDLPLRSRDRLPLMNALLGPTMTWLPPIARTTGSNVGNGSGSCARTSTSTCSPTSRSQPGPRTIRTYTTGLSTGSTMSPICTVRCWPDYGTGSPHRFSMLCGPTPRLR
ncbi:orn/Lys/Arg family decarboxylase domain protein [Mycobacterium ulcerans str. Harvey]|uniref:Orn/Lys/Arg family decarboxylase domain protein n=1 Tax=Mycobacterium ulcerans str. Harvey TaxID=1299332 RepID=A0ABP3AK75_MYCUL|nr:orn/Lys/Arg family decarboxylase domain protein [Mycobacterium ulcerans str. Harvey]